MSRPLYEKVPGFWTEAVQEAYQKRFTQALVVHRDESAQPVSIEFEHEDGTALSNQQIHWLEAFTLGAHAVTVKGYREVKE